MLPGSRCARRSPSAIRSAAQAIAPGATPAATDDDDMHEAELRTLRRGFARIMASPQIIGRLAEAGPSGR